MNGERFFARFLAAGMMASAWESHAMRLANAHEAEVTSVLAAIAHEEEINLALPATVRDVFFHFPLRNVVCSSIEQSVSHPFDLWLVFPCYSLFAFLTRGRVVN